MGCALALGSGALLAGKAETKKAQEALTQLGYDLGEPDGAWGGKSRKALNAFQEKEGFKKVTCST